MQRHLGLPVGPFGQVVPAQEQPGRLPKAQAPCHLIACKPSTGQCEGSADLAQDGTACDDKDACTVNTVCTGGVCAGTPKSCNDNNPCTVDNCALGTCVFAPSDGTPCDDNNACTTGDLCGAGKCVGGTAVVCASLGCGGFSTCDPKIGCPAAGSKPTCSILNFCVNSVCDDAVGCVGVPKSPPAQCGSGASQTATCQYGTCPTCKAYSLAVEQKDVDFALGDAALDASDVWMVGTAGVAPMVNVWFAKVAADKGVKQTVMPGGPAFNSLTGVVGHDAATMLAAGRTLGDYSKKMQGWLVSIDKTSVASKDSAAHGDSEDDGFWGVLATGEKPIVFGISKVKSANQEKMRGWLAQVNPNLSLATSTHQVQANYDVQWRAAAIANPTDPVFYVAGVAVDIGGVVWPVVGAYTVKGLDQQWLEVLNVAGAEAYGMTVTSKGITLAGVMNAGFAARGWMGRVNTQGKQLVDAFEFGLGASAYYSVCAAKAGDVVAAGGADSKKGGTSDLTDFGWLVPWTISNSAGASAGVAHMAVVGEQTFRRILPYNNGYLLAGDIKPDLGKRKAWLLQLDSAGNWACQP